MNRLSRSLVSIAPALRGGASTSNIAPALRGGASIVALAWLLCACASHANAPAANTAQAAAKPPSALPALPDDPLQLVPPGLRAIASIDMIELRASPVFARAKRWSERQTCVDATLVQWLTERTERVVVAGYVENAQSAKLEGDRGLGLFRGQYTSDDAREALAQARAAATGVNAAVITQEARGRFSVSHADGYASVLLDPHLLAVGTEQEVSAMLEVADGKRTSWLAGPLFMRGVDSAAWLKGHTLSGFAQVDENGERRLGHALSQLGASQISQGLAHSPAALALSLRQGAQAELHVQYPTSGAAAQAAGQLRSLLDQAAFLLRLAGVSFGLETAKIAAEAEQLSFALDVSPAQLERLLDQLESTLEQSASGCARAGGA